MTFNWKFWYFHLVLSAISSPLVYAFSEFKKVLRYPKSRFYPVWYAVTTVLFIHLFGIKWLIWSDNSLVCIMLLALRNRSFSQKRGILQFPLPCYTHRDYSNTWFSYPSLTDTLIPFFLIFDFFFIFFFFFSCFQFLFFVSFFLSLWVASFFFLFFISFPLLNSLPFLIFFLFSISLLFLTFLLLLYLIFHLFLLIFFHLFLPFLFSTFSPFSFFEQPNSHFFPSMPPGDVLVSMLVSNARYFLEVVFPSFAALVPLTAIAVIQLHLSKFYMWSFQ